MFILLHLLFFCLLSNCSNLLCSNCGVRRCKKYISGHVASYTRSWPHFQGTIKTPSGRFPSERYRPEGSRRYGTCAATKALYMMSLTAEWRWWRPALFCSLSHVWQTETPLPLSVGRYGFDIEVVPDGDP